MKRRRRIGIAAAVAVALLACVQVGRFAAKSGVGGPCRSDDECRSGQCIRLFLLPASDGTAHQDGQVCTTTCSTDLDCGSDMVCRKDPTAPAQRPLCVRPKTLPLPLAD